jgi:acyl-CoA dehydrogenase
VPIQFDPDPVVTRLTEKTTEFVREVVIPAERACGGSVHDAPESLRRTLQQGAREAGVFAPHVPGHWGGHGLDLRGQAAVFEAAGYSLLGPLALNCAAPDEGNMHRWRRSPPKSRRSAICGHSPRARRGPASR